MKRELTALVLIASLGLLVSACGGGGGGTSDGGGSTPPPATPTVSISASAAVVATGTSVTLTWSSLNATTCVASGNWTGSKATSGSEQVAVSGASVYGLSCTGAGGTAQSSVQVAIAPQPTVTLSASSASVLQGSNVSLSWATQNATSCIASGGWSGSKELSGTEQVTVSANSTFTLSCSGAGGASQASTAVTVVPAPTVTISASASTVVSGSQVTLTWASQNATSCTASGSWSGAKPLTGQESVGPITTESLFTLTCTGPSGAYQAETLVTIANSPPVVQSAAYQVMMDDELHLVLQASDPDGDPITFRVVTPPRLGTLVPLTGAPNGTYAYSAFEGVSGPDSFTYSASDGRFEAGPATVKLSVVRLHAESDPWMQFVHVPEGMYRMGNTFQWYTGDDRPVHTVTLTKGFYLGRLEVTQGQWTAVMGSNPSLFSYGAEYPVDSVSWDDSQAFLLELSNRTGFRYRLPTEAEWEYAARDGGLVTQWSGTSNEAELDRYAWFNANTGQMQTQPTGTKLPNALGLHDMSGNVMEWVQDSYALYPAEAVVDPLAVGGDMRVTRGGSFRYDPMTTRTVSPRFTDTPSGRLRDYGLRVALTDEPIQQEIEPKNSQMAGAGKLVPGVPVVAKLDSLNDVDWYYVEAGYANWISVEFEIGTPPGAFLWQVTWYGPDGSTILSQRNINSTFSYSVVGLTGNVHWVKVNRPDADFLFSSRPYRLTATLTQ